jgi:fido (protein-threonine AMPylation protein)
MPRATTTFSLEAQSEVFFSTTRASRAIRRHLAAGEIRHVQGRLYTKNLSEPLEAIVRRRAWDVAAGYFPGAVVADRTAFELQPAGPEGSVFLCSATQRVVRLPGLTLNCRRGPGPTPEDQAFLSGGLHLSSPARAYLDNMRPSRSRGGAVPRTLSRSELEERLQTILDNQGEQALNRLRDQARTLKATLGAAEDYARLDALIGTLLSTHDEPLQTARARAGRDGLAWDEARLPLFDALLAALNAHVPSDRAERPDQMGAPFAFFEAYFSNFIEGTEFSVEEAEEIVFAGAIPEGRPRDAHDVLGTYGVVSDRIARATVPHDFGSLERILRDVHERMLDARPEIAPGTYKSRPNRAGSTEFVSPSLVRGTLARGFERSLALPPGFQRAVFAMFLVAEVHPFTDGNGRVARALANAELSAAGQQRLIVPTILRDDYLNALRAMSHHANPIPLIRLLDRAQDLCAQLDWSDVDEAEAQLRALHAFMTPSEADAAGSILRLPSERQPAA